jgi:hypothetical protein
MDVYREYIDVGDDGSGHPGTLTVRMCHDFPPMQPTGSNRVVIFDDRVPMSPEWSLADMPTDTWAALAV